MPETVACNLCGSAAASVLPKETSLLNFHDPIQVCRCAKCGLMFLNPRRTVQELKQMYESDPYYSRENAARGLGRLDFYNEKWARLERWNPQRGRLLGIGCLDGGYVLSVAAKRGWKVVGVEFSEIMADFARSALQLDVKASEAWDLSGFENQTFDAIFSLSLEHVPDPRLTLRQCKGLLKSNGLLFLEVPNQFYSLIDVLKKGVARVAGEGAYKWFHREINFEYHLYYFVPETIKEALRRESYEILELRTFLVNHPLYHGGWMRRWLQEPINFAGSLVQRGPCIEIIARPRN